MARRNQRPRQQQHSGKAIPAEHRLSGNQEVRRFNYRTIPILPAARANVTRLCAVDSKASERRAFFGLWGKNCDSKLPPLMAKTTRGRFLIGGLVIVVCGGAWGFATASGNNTS